MFISKKTVTLKIMIKKIVIGEEITNYLNYAIKEVEKFNWFEKIASLSDKTVADLMVVREELDILHEKDC